MKKIFITLNLKNFALCWFELYLPDWKLNCVIDTPLQRNGVDQACKREVE